jgi:adenylate kinase
VIGWESLPGRFVGITGTPGTGKKTIAPLLAALLGIPPLSLNELSATSGVGVQTMDGVEVDTEALRRALLSAPGGRSLVYGHLLPDVLRRDEAEAVFVLRCNPTELRRRLVERGYGGRRLLDNLESELIGVTLDAAIDSFGEELVLEYDTTRASPDAAAKALSRKLGQRPASRRRIDWTRDYTSAEKLRSLLSEESTGSART